MMWFRNNFLQVDLCPKFVFPVWLFLGESTNLFFYRLLAAFGIARLEQNFAELGGVFWREKIQAVFKCLQVL